ncbi:MAG: TonB-dependent receptor, partial [Myxococcota bacterium]
AIELFDLERIEVAKGPQGTLFSRGASNGAINFIFRRPDDERYAEAAVQYGNFDNRRLQLVLNSPLREDKAWIRIGMVYHERNGFVDNLVDGETLNGKNTIHVRSVLTYKPVESVKMDLIAYAQVDNPEQTAFKTIVPGLDIADPFTDSTGQTLDTPVDGFSPVALDPSGELVRRVSGVTYLLDWDVNDNLRISSTSGLRLAEGDENFDLDGSSIPLLVSREIQTDETIFQELRFTYDTQSIFSMFGGGSFYRQTSGLDRRVDFSQDNLFNIVLPGLTGTPLPVDIVGLGDLQEQTVTENTTTSFSAFIDGTLDIIEDTLSITGGARVTRDEKEYTYSAPTADPNSALVLAFSDLSQLGPALGGDAGALLAFLNSIPTNPFSTGNSTLSNGSSGLFDLLGIPSALVPPGLETNALAGTTDGQVLSTSGNFSYIEPRAIIEFRPLDGLLTYVSYARGIRSGGLDIDPRQGAEEAQFARRIEKESVQSYEFG